MVGMTEEEKAEEEARIHEIEDMYSKGEISEAEYKTLVSTETQKEDG